MSRRILRHLPTGTRASLIPYKTSEYLAARRPILAAVPDGDARDILAPMPHVSVVRPADVDGMAAALRRRVAAADAAPAGRESDTQPPADDERARCVARIAGVLDGVTGRTAAYRVAA